MLHIHHRTYMNVNIFDPLIHMVRTGFFTCCHELKTRKTKLQCNKFILTSVI